MPFTRKTRRQLSRHIVTLSRLNEANWQVTAAMERLGLWSDELDEVTVWLAPVSWSCYGWHSGGPGSISIPGVSFAQLGDYLSGRHIRLTDILRHEWAHAVADVHPGFVDCPRFVRCFGGHESAAPVSKYNPARHITRYAATMPCEDYAEVFHFYLRHKGRLPVRLTGKPVIAKKWRLIANIARRLAAGHSGF